MTYGQQFIEITWMFTINGTDEVADTSLKMTGPPGWTGAVAALGELDGGGFGGALLGYYGDMMNHCLWADYSRLVGVKIAARGRDGKYLTDAVVTEDGSPQAGGSTNLPPQETVVLSLRSGQTFGGGNYGRMYLPHTSLALQGGTPYAVTANVTALLTAGKTFINAVSDGVNDATTAVLYVAIMSQAAGEQTKGVTEVGVGRVIDTQRRRRNRLTEATQLVSLT